MKNNSRAERYYELCLLIHQTCISIVQTCWAELKQYKISPSTAMVLYTVQALGGQAGPSEIARLVMRKPHSVSELLNRMEKAGLVTEAERPRPKIRGRRSMKLTKKGLEVYAWLVSRGSIIRLMSVLSEEDLCKLRSILETLKKEAVKLDVAMIEEHFPNIE